MNSRHPETPARGKAGSEPQLLTPFRVDPVDPVDPVESNGSGGEFQKCDFC